MKPTHLSAFSAALLALVVAVPACTSFDEAVGQSSQAITFGDPDGDDHPNVGAFMYGWYYGFPNCSGTLIYKDGDGNGLFLTAGHCVESAERQMDLGNMTEEHFWVSFDEAPTLTGSPPFTRGEDDFEIIGMHKLVIRPSSSVETAEDIGVLVLKATATQVLPEPEALPHKGESAQEYLDSFTQKELIDSNWLVVGYGGSLEFPPPQVYFPDVRQRSTPTYLNRIHHMLKMQQNPSAENSGACSGDSGAPLFKVEPDTGEHLVAIAIGGPKNCHSQALYYRLDAPTPREFIDEIIAGLSRE